MSEWNFYTCPKCGNKWTGNPNLKNERLSDKCPKCKTQGETND